MKTVSNEKLALALGYVKKRQKFLGDWHYWIDPIGRELINIPNFIKSLDALVLELVRMKIGFSMVT